MSTLEDARDVARDVDLTPFQQLTLRTLISDHERLVRELAETDFRLRHEHARAERLAGAIRGFFEVVRRAE